MLFLYEMGVIMLSVLNRGLRNSFVQRGMKVYLIKAAEEQAIFDKFEALRIDFATLPHTAFHMLESREAASMKKTALVILSDRSFCVNDGLIKEARNMVLSGSGEEIIDLDKKPDLAFSMPGC
jgi:hypothetical protein